MSPEFRLRPSLSASASTRASAAVAAVSPEFRLRPSLSELAWLPEHPCLRVSPEFRLRPSLSVEMVELSEFGGRRVAGVQTPAFVERRWRAVSSPAPGGVSPEFRLRPSLSGDRQYRRRRPATGVSPEFRLRPSLSAAARLRLLRQRLVSPEFRLRPSLSGGTVGAEDRQEDRVAGVQTPAFVERSQRRTSVPGRSSCRRSSDSGLR